MSLDWSIEDVPSSDTTCFVSLDKSAKGYEYIEPNNSRSWFWSKDNPEVKKCMNPITELLITKTMNCGLGEITEDNISEWEFRLFILETIHNSGECSRWNFDTGFWDECKIQHQDLVDHIGLSTNVLSLSREDWLEKQMMYLKSLDQNYSFRRRWKKEENNVCNR